MPKQTKEQMKNTLLVIARHLPIRKELVTLIVAAIGSLSEEDMFYFLRVLGRPETSWKLMMTLSGSIGAARAFEILRTFPEAVRPEGVPIHRPKPAQKAGLTFARTDLRT